VVISAPSGDDYYGGAVAGPVFKDVADKVYSTSLEIHKEINPVQTPIAFKVPQTKQGSQDELSAVLKALNIPVKTKNETAEWVSSAATTDSLSVNLTASTTETSLKQGIVPNLTGMTARDVMYLLENNGLRVKLVGSGAVAKQSLIAGTIFKRGTEIILQLI
jgi:cell division protein FtsI (penicillin-binding protein 3)